MEGSSINRGYFPRGAYTLRYTTYPYILYPVLITFSTSKSFRVSS